MDNEITKPHDHFIRSAMSHKEVSREFFEHNLPAHVKDLIDLDSIESIPESFVDEKLQEQITDMLFSVKIQNEHQNELGYIYLLVEHQSRAEKFMAWRLHRYITAIMDKHFGNNNELPIVIPIVFYNGQNEYNYSTNLLDLFANKPLAEKILLKPFHLVDLNNVADDDLNKFVFYGTIARVMKHIRDSELSRLLEDLLETLFFWRQNGYNKMCQLVINYMFNAGDAKEKEKFKQILNKKTKTEGGKTMTLTDEYINEGIEIGVRQGIQKGIQKGMQKGKKEGWRAAKIAIAKKLKREQVSTNLIKTVSGLSAKEIEKL